MADEPLPFNADALKSQIRGEVRGALTEIAQQAQQQAQQQRQQQAASQAQQQANGDPIYNAVVKPYVEPIARQSAIDSQGALDAVRFYGRNPGAVKYMDQIERQFSEMANRGLPFDRNTIFNHYRGQHFDHFVKEQADQLAAAAAQNATVGAPGVGRPGAGPVLTA